MQSENRIQRPIVTKLEQNSYKINLNNVPMQNKDLFWKYILNTKYKIIDYPDKNCQWSKDDSRDKVRGRLGNS